MGESVNSDKRGTPAWATRAFERYVNESEGLVRLIQLSARGISVIRAVPQALEALAKADRHPGEGRLTEARAEAELAAKEVREEFPLLHGFGTVALWSLLEAAVLEFVAEWLKHRPATLQLEPVSKLRVRVGEYEALEGDERYAFLAALLDREASAGLRNGVDRFETLLRPLGLTGPVPRGLSQDVFELGQVRNGIVHGGGRVDHQLARSCPWLEFRPGDELRVSRSMFKRYASATERYVVLLICRVGEEYNMDMAEHRDGIFAEDEQTVPPASP